MTHLTLSVPKKTFDTIKRHPEIKWTEIARQSLVAYADEIEGVTTTDEIRLLLGPKLVKSIDSFDEEKSKVLFKKMEEGEWKRLR